MTLVFKMRIKSARYHKSVLLLLLVKDQDFSVTSSDGKSFAQNWPSSRECNVFKIPPIDKPNCRSGTKLAKTKPSDKVAADLVLARYNVPKRWKFGLKWDLERCPFERNEEAKISLKLFIRKRRNDWRCDASPPLQRFSIFSQ